MFALSFCVLVVTLYTSCPFVSLAKSLFVAFFGFSNIFKRVLCPVSFSNPVTPSKSLSQWLHVISCSGTLILYPLPWAPVDVRHLLALPPSKRSVPVLPHSGQRFLKTVLYSCVAFTPYFCISLLLAEGFATDTILLDLSGDSPHLVQ